MAIITATADEQTLAGLDRLAAEYGRSREGLIAAAVERYVKDETAFCDFVQEGEDALARGDYITHDELVARLKARKQAKRAA